jgi:diguanylate cyclase (GGDEF)-like protein/PAS domain S-box-containing protein
MTVLEPGLAQHLCPGVLLLDPEGRIVWHNEQAATLFGTPELRGHCADRWLAGLPPPEVALARRAPERRRVSLKGRAVGGRELELEGECAALREAGAGAFLLLLRESGRAHATEHRLHMLAQAVMQTDDAVMITSERGVIQFVNPSFERISGYSAREVVGQTPNLLRSGEHSPEFFAALWHALRRGEVFRGVFINRHRSGRLYYEEKTITPIRDASGGVTHYVSTGRDVTERVLSDARLDLLAHYDVLTGLPNRTLFMDRLERAIARCRRDAGRVAVLFVDLDRFKTINDTLGYQAGDALLRQAAERLCATVRFEDSVARLGADEFTVILEGPGEATACARVAEAIAAAFARPFVIDGRTLYVGASVGVAAYPGDGGDAASLVKHADIALFHAKSRGRSTCVHYSGVMEGGLLEDLSLEAALRVALDNGEFRIVYQPVVCAASGRTLALEALLRWHSPVHGKVSPERFIPMLEANGLIVPVGRWVLETACREVGALRCRRDAEVMLAINLSGCQFRDDKLLDDIRNALAVSGLPPHRLEFEITESVLIEDSSGAGQTLLALRALGVRLAIDDFGTGYSSLSYLRRFPINTLKIDRSFVSGLESSPDAVAIVRAIVNLAHSLGLEVVGEGVETTGQLALLADLGCARMQGYWFSRPLPLAQLELA